MIKLLCLIIVVWIASVNAQGITNTLGGITADDKFIVENNNSKVGLVVTGEGNVGIGTLIPLYNMEERGLEVRGNNPVIIVNSIGSTSGGIQALYSNSTYRGIALWGTHNTTNLLFGYSIYPHGGTDFVPRMFIDNKNGRVGIGTISPAGNLHVNGDDGVLFTGTYGEGSFILPSGAGTRLMWYSQKAAFRAGSVDKLQWDDAYIGDYSTAMGSNTTARGDYSTAMGYSTLAFGDYSTAMGSNSTAWGVHSTAIGENTTARGKSSTALGGNTTARGIYSATMGNNTTASGPYSTAMGNGTTADGNQSTAMGYITTAVGNSSFAMGWNTVASGDYSTAMGIYTIASGKNSTAMGNSTIASGNYSIAMGSNTFAIGSYSTAMGNNTAADGDYSTAMGNNITITGEGSIFIGDNSPTVLTRNDDNYFYTRFVGGYSLYTDADGLSGVYMSNGANGWSSISDSTKKENFQKADGEYFLNSIANMNLGSWNYTNQKPEEFRHYGPMAQEIFHYFGNDDFGIIGNDTTLATTDMDGIIMIALQALEKRTTELQKQNEELRAENIDLLNRLSAVEDIFKFVLNE